MNRLLRAAGCLRPWCRGLRVARLQLRTAASAGVFALQRIPPPIILDSGAKRKKKVKQTKKAVKKAAKKPVRKVVAKPGKKGKTAAKTAKKATKKTAKRVVGKKAVKKPAKAMKRAVKKPVKRAVKKAVKKAPVKKKAGGKVAKKAGGKFGKKVVKKAGGKPIKKVVKVGGRFGKKPGSAKVKKNISLAAKHSNQLKVGGVLPIFGMGAKLKPSEGGSAGKNGKGGGKKAANSAFSFSSLGECIEALRSTERVCEEAQRQLEKHRSARDVAAKRVDAEDKRISNVIASLSQYSKEELVHLKHKYVEVVVRAADAWAQHKAALMDVALAEATASHLKLLIKQVQREERGRKVRSQILRKQLWTAKQKLGRVKDELENWSKLQRQLEQELAQTNIVSVRQ